MNENLYLQFVLRKNHELHLVLFDFYPLSSKGKNTHVCKSHRPSLIRKTRIVSWSKTYDEYISLSSRNCPFNRYSTFVMMTRRRYQRCMGSWDFSIGSCCCCHHHTSVDVWSTEIRIVGEWMNEARWGYIKIIVSHHDEIEYRYYFSFYLSFLQSKKI